MAKITLLFEAFEDTDGYDGSVQVERYDVNDLNGLVWFFSEAARSVGYTYVESISAYKEDGTEVRSDF